MNPNFVGRIINLDKFLDEKRYLYSHKSKTFFRGAMLSWDNTARKANTGATIFTGLTPDSFETWLTDIMIESKKIHSAEENMVFINAWNEWAEGTHLEPDIKYGYANLRSVKRAIEQSRLYN